MSANNTDFIRGFISIITWLLIGSKTAKLCLVLDCKSCCDEMEFRTNWLILKSTQVLENEIDPCL